MGQEGLEHPKAASGVEHSPETTSRVENQLQATVLNRFLQCCQPECGQLLKNLRVGPRDGRVWGGEEPQRGIMSSEDELQFEEVSSPHLEVSNPMADWSLEVWSTATKK